MLRPLAILLALSKLPKLELRQLYEFFTIAKLDITKLNSYCRAWNSASITEQFPAAYAAAEQHLAEMKAVGVHVTGWTEPDYPRALFADSYPPPPVLYYTGKPVTPDEQVVAIVGTRRASPDGLEFARELARELARYGITIVSGLALGIDGAAHRGALDHPEGRTVAVLGSGHHRIHPPTHTDLANRIIEAGGAIYSLWPPHITAERYTFLHRNSVITGLAQVLAIIEAGSPSGALNSASHALRQGRRICAMPGRPRDPRVRGSLQLINDGADMLLGPGDVLSTFKLQLHDTNALYEYEVSHILAEHGALTLDGIQQHSPLPLSDLLEQLTFAELTGEVRRGVDGTYRAVKGGATLER